METSILQRIQAHKFKGNFNYIIIKLENICLGFPDLNSFKRNDIQGELVL